jgi:hypothetical protein
MDLRETGWDGVDWIDMAQDRDQWRVLVPRLLVYFRNRLIFYGELLAPRPNTKLENHPMSAGEKPRLTVIKLLLCSKYGSAFWTVKSDDANCSARRYTNQDRTFREIGEFLCH